MKIARLRKGLAVAAEGIMIAERAVMRFPEDTEFQEKLEEMKATYAELQQLLTDAENTAVEAQSN
jgi:anion-transporting  ArsA/GET3 family ATPase